MFKGSYNIASLTSPLFQLDLVTNGHHVQIVDLLCYLRESEPNSWEDTMKDELDRLKYPRMPWHDVHCALWGPPCRDIARHFVQRWNYAKV